MKIDEFSDSPFTEVDKIFFDDPLPKKLALVIFKQNNLRAKMALLELLDILVRWVCLELLHL